MFKLQSPSKHSSFDAISMETCFQFPSFWTCQFWCFLVFLTFFCFTNFTLAKHFPLRSFFIQKNIGCKIGWRERMGHGGHAIFGQNHWTLSTVSAGTLINYLSRNGQMCWKSLKKKIHWSWMQPLITPPAGALIQMVF